MKSTVIIPCFNDSLQIKYIVKIIKSSKLFSEIIIVDDGSKKETKLVLRNIRGIKLITHPKNLGKSQALKTGIISAKNKIILFLDADLIGLTVGHLHQLVDPVLTRYCDLCIGQFVDPFSIFVKIGQTVMLSGLRCCRKQILINNLSVFESHGYFDGYLVEAKFNKLLFQPQYKVYKANLLGLTQKYKWQKNNFLTGAYLDARMMFNILKYLGPRQYLKQLLYSQHLPHSP